VKTSMYRNSRQRKSKVKGAVRVVDRASYEEQDLDTRVALIQALIPLGLMHIEEEIQKEVLELAGLKHQRKSPGQPSRHGSNPGSVKLLDQVVPFQVPRLRDGDGEVPLSSYRQFHEGVSGDEGLFKKVLYGISCRNYETAAEAFPGAIGISKSSVSRKFIETSKKKLQEFQQRSLEGLDIVALFLDGKTFAEDEMVIAVTVTLAGDKVIVGFVQTETENKVAMADFLRSLLNRGLDISRGILVVIDGAKGLRAAVKQAFSKRAVVQRCQWHKRENVLSYLPKKERPQWRRRLQKAYQQPTYEKAKSALMKIHAELEDCNPSAASSLAEGMDETLTLHRLCVFPLVGRSFKTTNIIESVNAMAEERCAKVDCWTNGKQKHRWLAAALLDIEPRLKRFFGYRYLPTMREAIMKELNLLPAKKDVALAA
jgi:putative transposase